MPEDKKKKEKPLWFKAAHYLAGKGMGLIYSPKRSMPTGQMGAESRLKAERWREKKKKIFREL